MKPSLFLKYFQLSFFSTAVFLGSSLEAAQNNVTLSPGSSALIEANQPTQVFCSGDGMGGGLRFCQVAAGSSSICGFDNVCVVLRELVGTELKSEVVSQCGDEDNAASWTKCETVLEDHPSCRAHGRIDCFVKNGSSSICGFDNVCLVARYKIDGQVKEESLARCGDEDESTSFDKCNEKLKKHPACRAR